MAIDVITLAMANSYTEETVGGMGALKGADGDSAYQIAVNNGFEGTEEEWLESLEGEVGPQGTFENLTEEQKISLKGEQGPQGEKGEKGEQGPQGEKGEKGEQGELYNDQEIKESISNIERSISIINGTSDGSINKIVTNKIAEVIANAPEDLNTLREISDWISNHSNDASAMNSAIKDNTKSIANLETDIQQINDDLKQKNSNHITLPNGLKISWGCATTTNSNGYYRRANIVFETEYTETPIVMITKVVTPNLSATETGITTGVAPSMSPSGGNIYAAHVSGGLADFEVILNWIAIGY